MATTDGRFEPFLMQGREHDQELEEKQTEESDVHFDEDDKLRLEQVLVRTSPTLV